jgi:hypothetical protein
VVVAKELHLKRNITNSRMMARLMTSRMMWSVLTDSNRWMV